MNVKGVVRPPCRLVSELDEGGKRSSACPVWPWATSHWPARPVLACISFLFLVCSSPVCKRQNDLVFFIGTAIIQGLLPPVACHIPALPCLPSNLERAIMNVDSARLMTPPC
jgi:hypothetical protein